MSYNSLTYFDLDLNTLTPMDKDARIQSLIELSQQSLLSPVSSFTPCVIPKGYT